MSDTVLYKAKDELERLSPVPIYYGGRCEVMSCEYQNISRFDTINDGCAGHYMDGSHILVNGVPDKRGCFCIEEVFTLAHEIGHAICFRDNCFCSSYDTPAIRSVCEAHADIYAIRLFRTWNPQEILDYAVNRIKARLGSSDCRYRDSAKYTMSLNEYKAIINNQHR